MESGDTRPAYKTANEGSVRRFEAVLVPRRKRTLECAAVRSAVIRALVPPRKNRGQTELSTRRKPGALGQFRLSPVFGEWYIRLYEPPGISRTRRCRTCVSALAAPRTGTRSAPENHRTQNVRRAPRQRELGLLQDLHRPGNHRARRRI